MTTSVVASAAELSVPTVTAEALLARRDAVVIDLRSPAEFAEDHLPGAINLPLLDDLGRALVGRLYGQVSPSSAFGEARELVRGRIHWLLQGVFAAAGEPVPATSLAPLYERLTQDGIAGLEGSLCILPGAPPPERAIVLCCWRGGLRSRSVVALLRGLGVERAVGLEQGYKGYRAHVRTELALWRAPPTIVLRGLTGVGKTLVLDELERLRPGWTVDLEALAGHRSSILGGVGMIPASQKAFESRLAARLRRGFAGPLVLEGESRKVGDAIVPAALWRALEEGTSIELEAALERRVHVLLEDYLATESRRAELRGALPFLERRLGACKWAGRLVALLDERRDAELAELLLERYYDPLYRQSESRHARAAAFDSSDPARAAAEVAAWIERRLAGGRAAP